MRTIWLASYPKSGSTWFRILVANLSASDDQPVGINDLFTDGGIASARRPFDDLLLVESGLLTHDEIDGLRPRAYAAMADDEDDDPACDGVRFVKVHDAYTVTSQGEPLLAGAAGADGGIVLVRDPRDVAPSLANHLRITLEDAIALMNDVNARVCDRANGQPAQLRQKLLAWSGHVASWLDQRDIPVCLVRYEDMLRDTAGTLERALAFARLPVTHHGLRRAVRFADFARLQSQEQEKGFREGRLGGHFFRRGRAGAWRDELTAAQVECVEAAHSPMMYRLGYQVSDASSRRT